MFTLNRHNFSPTIYNFLKNDTYDHEDPKKLHISGSSLDEPLKPYILDKNLPHKRDVSDLIKIKIGEAVHDSVLMTMDFKGICREKRFDDVTINVDGETCTLRGKPDEITWPSMLHPIKNLLHDSGVTDVDWQDRTTARVCIADIKSAQKYKLMYKDFEKFKLQLSFYRYILMRSKTFKDMMEKYQSFFISDLALIYYIMLDHTQANMKLSLTPIKEIVISLYDDQTIEKIILNVIRERIPYWGVTDQTMLPACNEDTQFKYRGKYCFKYCKARACCLQRAQLFGPYDASQEDKPMPTITLSNGKTIRG